MLRATKVTLLVAAFSERSILVETTGYQCNRSFVFTEYVGMFQ